MPARRGLLLDLVEGRPIGKASPREPRQRKQKSMSKKSLDATAHYIAVRLGHKSRKRLLDNVAAKHPQVHADHVTLVSRPGEDDITRYQKLAGRQVSFHATHHAHDEDSGIQAVRVRGLDHLSDKDHKHVTVSTGPDVPAARSNDLLARTKGKRLPNWIPLTGTIEVAERKGSA